jgi:hypothetical protein
MALIEIYMLKKDFPEGKSKNHRTQEAQAESDHLLALKIWEKFVVLTHVSDPLVFTLIGV